jgi:hypothetical protein
MDRSNRFFSFRLSAQDQSEPELQTCERMYPGQPGEGVAYKGTVSNSDYRFSATLPGGLTGWGSGSGAPFHGFVMFLNDKTPKSSCIAFYIRIRVDIPENPPVPTVSGAPPVAVGNRRGIQTLRKGVVNGIGYENRIVSLELPRNGYVNDLTITLVTPTSDKARTVPIFEKFVAGLKFW